MWLSIYGIVAALLLVVSVNVLFVKGCDDGDYAAAVALSVIWPVSMACLVVAAIGYGLCVLLTIPARCYKARYKSCR